MHEYKDLEESSPRLYKTKVDLVVKLKKSLLLEKALNNELTKNTERIKIIQQQHKYEEMIKS